VTFDPRKRRSIELLRSASFPSSNNPRLAYQDSLTEEGKPRKKIQR
jgi:hypothetical protein